MAMPLIRAGLLTHRSYRAGVDDATKDLCDMALVRSDDDATVPGTRWVKNFSRLKK